MGMLSLASWLEDEVLTVTSSGFISQTPVKSRGIGSLPPHSPFLLGTSVIAQEGESFPGQRRKAGGRLPCRAEGQLFIL